MLPPTLADFNYKIDDYCFFAEENSKVMRLAHKMEITDSLQAYEGECILLSYFYTDRRKILDLVIFVSMPEGQHAHPISCFYFRDFLRRAYDVGKRLKEWVPADLLAAAHFQQELLSALNYLLTEIYPDSQAGLFQSRESWGFEFLKFQGRLLPPVN